MESKEETTTKGLQNKYIILTLGVLVIIGAVVITIFLLTKESSDDVPVATNSWGTPVINEDNVADIKEALDEKIASGMFETYMNTTWTFPSGKAPSNDAIMGNSVNNNYPFWFEVVVSETNNVVYTSSLLPVGTSLKEIVLSENLEKGEYPAVAVIHRVDENGVPVGSDVSFTITLVIQK
ncbi:hypothetical protein FACS1894219_05670 [Clostridia bacterium]|nr:hypothetical protein FACS1894219_05670 [Clostridia bacterium]